MKIRHSKHDPDIWRCILDFAEWFGVANEHVKVSEVSNGHITFQTQGYNQTHTGKLTQFGRLQKHSLRVDRW